MEKPEKPARQAEVMVLTEIDQLRAFSEPLRARILTELCKGEKTTKQVADALGEPPTKLYHHVEILERAGLVRLTRTRQNRGTLEKYFLGSARRFEVGGALLGGSQSDALTTAIDTLLDQTRNECHRLAAGDEALQEVLEESGLLSFVEYHADQKSIDRLMRRLRKLVEDLAGEDEGGDGADQERSYRLLLACYPLDRFPDS